MGDLARSNPLLQQLRLPRLGRAARGHVLLTKTLLIVGQEGSTQRGGPRAGVGDGAELRDPRPKTLRLRQGDWQGCWGGGAATQRDRSADDLHAERQAIHRRPDRGLQSICGTYRVVPALTQAACITWADSEHEQLPDAYSTEVGVRHRVRVGGADRPSHPSRSGRHPARAGAAPCAIGRNLDKVRNVFSNYFRACF